MLRGILRNPIYKRTKKERLITSPKSYAAFLRVQSFLLFSYFSAGNGGSASNLAQLLALAVSSKFKNPRQSIIDAFIK